MKSIRGSLVTYFFAVVVLALGAVSLLAYENSHMILRAKQEARADLLHRQFLENCKNEKDKLDNFLQASVNTLAKLARLQMQGRTDFAAFGMMSGLLNPNSAVFTTPLWFAGARFGNNPPLPGNQPLYRQLHGEHTQIDFDEERLWRSFAEADQAKEFSQINVNQGWPKPLRSPSMGNSSLPYDPGKAYAMEPNETVKDEFDWQPGTRVRRVAVRWPITGLSRGGRGGAAGANPGQRPRDEGFRGPAGQRGISRPPNAGRPPSPQQWMFVQCAAVTTDRDAAIDKLEESYQEELADLRTETQSTLASLRLKLWLINLGTLVATALGCLWFVHMGLSPLHRLSEAVSKVSPKDFRLPFEEEKLPSELRPIVDRLNATLDQLKRVFAREKQAAADISHEARTPLAALQTTIEVALKKPRSPEEYREILSDCHATGQQMTQLVERLLTLARLDSGVDMLRPRPVDVSALTEQCTTLVRPLAEAKGLALALNRNGPVTLKTDPDKFREIVTNLLHNAIAYNRPHGSIHVAIGAAAGNMCLEVRDSGIGISAQAMDHIFDRFYRVDSSRHAEGLHAGLGLSIVKGYVDLMGGNIKVESAVGQGSTFRVELPLPRHPDAPPVDDRVRL